MDRADSPVPVDDDVRYCFIECSGHSDEEEDEVSSRESAFGVKEVSRILLHNIQIISRRFYIHI